MKDMIGFGSDAARKSTLSKKIERFETAARWLVALGMKAEAYLGELYRHVPVLDSGARGATTSFVQRRLGAGLTRLPSDLNE